MLTKNEYAGSIYALLPLSVKKSGLTFTSLFLFTSATITLSWCYRSSRLFVAKAHDTLREAKLIRPLSDSARSRPVEDVTPCNEKGRKREEYKNMKRWAETKTLDSLPILSELYGYSRPFYTVIP